MDCYTCVCAQCRKHIFDHNYIVVSLKPYCDNSHNKTNVQDI